MEFNGLLLRLHHHLIYSGVWRFYAGTNAGKLFTVFIIIFGVGMMFYSLVLMAETFIDARLRNLLGRVNWKK